MAHWILCNLDSWITAAAQTRERVRSIWEIKVWLPPCDFKLRRVASFWNFSELIKKTPGLEQGPCSEQPTICLPFESIMTVQFENISEVYPKEFLRNANGMHLSSS